MFSAICSGTCRHYSRQMESASIHPLSSSLFHSFFPLSTLHISLYLIFFRFSAEFPSGLSSTPTYPITNYSSLSLSLSSDFIFNLTSLLAFPFFAYPFISRRCVRDNDLLGQEVRFRSCEATYRNCWRFRSRALLTLVCLCCMDHFYSFLYSWS